MSGTEQNAADTLAYAQEVLRRQPFNHLIGAELTAFATGRRRAVVSRGDAG